LARGLTKNKNIESRTYKVKSAFDLNSYIDGLASLDGDDVRELLQTCESRFYFSLKNSNIMRDEDEFVVALCAYLERIDDYILLKNGANRYVKNYELNRTINLSRGYLNSIYGGMGLEFIALALGSPLMLGPALNFLLNKAIYIFAKEGNDIKDVDKQISTENKNFAEKKLAADRYIKTIQKNKSGQKINIHLKKHESQTVKIDTIAGYKNS
jgi:hypothetical protein